MLLQLHVQVRKAVLQDNWFIYTDWFTYTLYATQAFKTFTLQRTQPSHWDNRLLAMFSLTLHQPSSISNWPTYHFNGFHTDLFGHMVHYEFMSNDMLSNNNNNANWLRGGDRNSVNFTYSLFVKLQYCLWQVVTVQLAGCCVFAEPL